MQHVVKRLLVASLLTVGLPIGMAAGPANATNRVTPKIWVLMT